ncbi:hypothetical protein Clacol_008311 [Clathrus columnatus]|uniref:Uncharacterized protein n=1 Tax=Clathrus columnatus TaxID=1419009 RepID=A0AAV5AHF1_9AGAM|nr:hypothetical protein Clacol_008311 [Clathrus columnatus]
MRSNPSSIPDPAMIILNEKQPPPPPYQPSSPLTPVYNANAAPPPFVIRRPVPKLDALPPNVLLRIVNSMFPSSVVDATVHRKTLYWLAMSLRLVSRGMYIACMHTLRSAYLSSYEQQIKPPYTSNPFPAIPISTTLSPVLYLGNRETRVLDLYIALKVREDVWADETELHLERDESFKDLFDLMQPKSRIEDLVLQYGSELGLITASPQSGRSKVPIPFSRLSVSFSPRTLGLILSSGGQKRTIVQCFKERGEKLEAGAKRLVRELDKWAHQTI